MTTFTRYFHKNPATLTLLLSVENTISDTDKLFFALSLLRRRFNTKVAFVFKSPEYLFFNKRVMRTLIKGEVDRVLVTDNPDNFWFDYIEFAKRQESNKLILCDCESIIDDWTKVLKFLVSLCHAHFAFVESKEFRCMAMDQAELRGVISNKARTIDQVFSYLQSAEPPILDSSLSIPSALFVTKEGIERFGGIDSFVNANIKIGNYFPSDYKRIWQVDNDLSVGDFLKEDINILRQRQLIAIPGLLLNENKSQVIIDINPGYLTSQSTNNNEVLSVPRTLLSITSTRDTKIVRVNKNAIFAMSNFNKAPYIAGAIYGVMMQSHCHCALYITDDISTDDSNQVINRFKPLIKSPSFSLIHNINKKSKGTYWIRNSIINQHIDGDSFYFVNDSDDISSCQRASIQLSFLEKSDSGVEVCFGDIVRVDKDFRLLPLDGKVERYGTASLGAPTRVHKKYGFYENIRKNADTEFIERLRHFSGNKSTKWFRYPILFQPFDGGNLTSDIYQKTTDGGLRQALNKRAKHAELFKKKHMSLKLEQLNHFYRYPNFSFDDDYKTELADFLVTLN